MIVMPSNNAKGIVHYWAGLGYPVGWLFTPENCVREPVPWMPYAIDNGRFSVWNDTQAPMGCSSRLCGQSRRNPPRVEQVVSNPQTIL